MRVLLVHAHPLPASLTRHFSDTARKALTDDGHEVEFVDLYQDGFDPRLTAHERKVHHQPHSPAPDIAPLTANLQGADALVLVFPTWWFGLPAIMKGFIDRVFAPGVGFAHGENFGPIKPLLKLRHAMVITTLGSPWWVDLFVMRRPVRRVLKMGVIGACAAQARFSYLPFYASENPSPQRVQAFSDVITKRCSSLS